MSANLRRFLVDLAINPDVMQRYIADPQSTMAAAGLTADEQTAVSSGDSVHLRTVLGKPDNECTSQISSSETIGIGNIMRLKDGSQFEAAQGFRADVCPSITFKPKRARTTRPAPQTREFPEGTRVLLADGRTVRLNKAVKAKVRPR